MLWSLYKNNTSASTLELFLSVTGNFLAELGFTSTTKELMFETETSGPHILNDYSCVTDSPPSTVNIVVIMDSPVI